MSYRLFGWWYRWQACKMAAQVVAGWNNGPDEGITPRIWSVTVFFERYMTMGGDGTQEDFGPKEPVELRDVSHPKS